MNLLAIYHKFPDNKLLEILIGCEPEVLSILSEEDSCRAQGVSTLKILSDLYDKELVNIIGWAKQIPGMYLKILFSKLAKTLLF